MHGCSLLRTTRAADTCKNSIVGAGCTGRCHTSIPFNDGVWLLIPFTVSIEGILPNLLFIDPIGAVYAEYPQFRYWFTVSKFPIPCIVEKEHILVLHTRGLLQIPKMFLFVSWKDFHVIKHRAHQIKLVKQIMCPFYGLCARCYCEPSVGPFVVAVVVRSLFTNAFQDGLNGWKEFYIAMSLRKLVIAL